jgi:hypothetical protein
MDAKQRSKFEKAAIGWLCFSIAVLLLMFWLYRLPNQPRELMQTASIIGVFSGLVGLAILAILAIPSIKGISVVAVVLAVAIGIFCYYLGEAFHLPEHYLYPAEVIQVLAVLGANDQLKRYDAVATKLFFVALGYLYGLMIRTGRWVRQAFNMGVSAALQDKSDSDRKDNSSEPL